MSPTVFALMMLKKLFEITLSKHDFNFKTLGQTYYISKKIPYAINNYSYPLKFNTFLDCKNILDFHGIKTLFFKRYFHFFNFYN